MMCADLVDIAWVDRAGRTCRTVANLEDISPSGVCLQVDIEIPLMTVVTISYPTGEYSGIVRYCQFKDIGHFVGIQFEGPKWAEDNYKPLHLLDPRELVARESSGLQLL